MNFVPIIREVTRLQSRLGAGRAFADADYMRLRVGLDGCMCSPVGPARKMTPERTRRRLDRPIEHWLLGLF